MWAATPKLRTPSWTATSQRTVRPSRKPRSGCGESIETKEAGSEPLPASFIYLYSYRNASMGFSLAALLAGR